MKYAAATPAPSILYEKYGFRKLCVFPRFFKINGEYMDFDLMNLELNTADDHIEGNMR